MWLYEVVDAEFFISEIFATEYVLAVLSLKCLEKIFELVALEDTYMLYDVDYANERILAFCEEGFEGFIVDDFLNDFNWVYMQDCHCRTWLVLFLDLFSFYDSGDVAWYLETVNFQDFWDELRRDS